MQDAQVITYYIAEFNTLMGTTDTVPNANPRTHTYQCAYVPSHYNVTNPACNAYCSEETLS